MLYARRSLNYQVSIRFVRRGALLMAYPLRESDAIKRSPMLSQHLRNAAEIGLGSYLGMDTFIHRNTDGPNNPFARVYSPREVIHDFPEFELLRHTKRYLHAPPLPVNRLPSLGRLLGWHMWVWMQARP